MSTHSVSGTPADPLMISISGVRGIVGSSLTPEVLVRYAAAFAEYCRRRTAGTPVVVLGRDGREGGRPLAGLISSTLLAAGVDVRAIGVAPTPTVALAVERTGAAGGIAVTASHNPIEWNGMKFFASTGLFLNGEENVELRRIGTPPLPPYAPWNGQGVHRAEEFWIDRHISAVLSIPYLDLPALRARKFRVVADCVNASGAVIVPRLLRELGCDVHELHCAPSGVFPHPPEPLPENLSDLTAAVRERGADLGLAVDPDADRLVFVTERGEPFGEENTIAAATRFVLERERAASADRPLRVVINLSTTRAVEDIAAALGAEVIRTPVGEINVAGKMLEVGSVIGGEGSGGVILPAVHAGRDAMVGIALVLQLLAERGETLSALRAGLPAYAIAKGRIALGDRPPGGVLETLRRRYAGSARVNTDDGLRIDFPDRWVHLRKSNTEPIVRVIAEARSAEEASALVEDFRRELAAPS